MGISHKALLWRLVALRLEVLGMGVRVSGE